LPSRSQARRGTAGLLAAALLLAGCGFRPLYGNPGAPGSTVPELAAIRVALQDNRIGQLVRNHLLDSLNPTGQPVRPRYALEMEMERDRENLAKRPDDVTTRISLTLSARYRLKDASSGAVVASGERRAIASYDVVRSEYANLVSQQDAESRAAQQLADAIRLALAVHFSGQRR